MSAIANRFTLLSALLVLLTSCTALAAPAPLASSTGVLQAGSLAPTWDDEYGRLQVRVALPSRHARWNAPPPGAVRVYHRRFDPRWGWRAAPRHHVVYTYFRGDLWFLDPTTGWAYSVDRYGMVYTADPYRGWVYSLGPLTRWTADLLYFFDLYRFDRGYWYCRDYDYFVDTWETRSRYGHYTYDTAYSSLWQWEPYFASPAFVSYSLSFTTVFVTQVRSHHGYIERNPYYRREYVDAVGLAAVAAAPPRMVSPRAVATSAYWEARDLAVAGVRAPGGRGRGDARNARDGVAALQAGSIVDARSAPAWVAESGAPVPGFNAPLPEFSRDGSGRGAQPAPGRERERPRETVPGAFGEPEFVQPERGRGRDEARGRGEWAGRESQPAAEPGERGRDRQPRESLPGFQQDTRDLPREPMQVLPQRDAPVAEPPRVREPARGRDEPDPRRSDPRREREAIEPRREREVSQPAPRQRFEERPAADPPAREPMRVLQAPPEQPRHNPPPRQEAPTPRQEAPRQSEDIGGGRRGRDTGEEQPRR